LSALEVGVAATGAGVVGSRSVSLDTNAVIAAIEGGAPGAAAVANAMAGKAPVVSATVVSEFAKKGNLGALADFLKANGGTVVKGASADLVKQMEARGLAPADARAVAAAMESGTKFLTRDAEILKKAPDVAQRF
jgi:predicted nucleic acid-binding protein